MAQREAEGRGRKALRVGYKLDLDDGMSRQFIIALLTFYFLFFPPSEIAFQRTLAEKRRKEAEENAKKLKEARHDFQRSRETLKALIVQKEERSKKSLLEKQR